MQSHAGVLDSGMTGRRHEFQIEAAGLRYQSLQFVEPRQRFPRAEDVGYSPMFENPEAFCGYLLPVLDSILALPSG